MKPIYDKLVSQLELLIELHRELLEIEQKKMESILNQNWKKLEKLVVMSEEILQRIDTAEVKRLEIVKKIAGIKKIEYEKLREKLPNELRPELESAREKLLGVIEQLRDINGKTKSLLEGSLEIIDFSISLFAGNGNNTKTYSGNGKESGEQRSDTSLLFDVKA